jgi:hypothetical protein
MIPASERAKTVYASDGLATDSVELTNEKLHNLVMNLKDKGVRGDWRKWHNYEFKNL